MQAREYSLQNENKQAREYSLQDIFLRTLSERKIPVAIFLVNGIKLQGHIEEFDDTVVILKNAGSQMVFKHAISTVMPSHLVNNTGGFDR